MRFTASAALAALASIGACRTSASGYFADRLNDTIDMIPFSIASGPGLYFGARATALAGVAVGYAETTRAGWRRRPTWTAHPDELAGFRVWSETAKGLTLVWDRTNDPPPGAGNLGPVPARTLGGPWAYSLGLDPGTALDAELEAHLGYVGLRIGASPLQAIDWLLGWFLLDAAGDDLHRRLEGKTFPAPPPPAEPASQPAPARAS